MTTAAYHIGDAKRLTAAFTVGTPPVATDPATLSFLMREPDGTVTAYIFGVDGELVKDSTGNFHVDWTVGQRGRHGYRWVGTGAATEADQGEFYGLANVAGV